MKLFTKKKKFEIVFIPHNEYHFRTCLNLSTELEKYKISSCFIDLTNQFIDYGVREFASRNNIQNLFDVSLLLSGRIKTKSIFVMNDFSGKVNKLLEISKINKIIRFGLTEGPLYGDDLDDYYNNVDVLFTCGKYEDQYYSRKGLETFLVGLPRLDDLLKEKIEFKDKPKILINLNFSFHDDKEELRGPWLEDVIKSCNSLGYEFVINKHYADKAEIPYPVSKNSFYEDCREASLLITRESSVILESLALGKPVVFHNKFEYKMDYYLKTLNAFSVSTNLESLKKSIEYEINRKYNVREYSKKYLSEKIYIDKQKHSIELISNSLKNKLNDQVNYFILQKYYKYLIMKLMIYLYENKKIIFIKKTIKKVFNIKYKIYK